MTKKPTYKPMLLNLSAEEIKLLEEFQKAKGLRTRSEAVRQAMRIGMGETATSEPEVDVERVVREVMKALKFR